MKPIKCRLLSIKCFRSSESNGDEVYLKVNGKKIWPIGSSFIKMDPGAESRLDLLLLETGGTNSLKVQLYDSDLFVDDFLGGFHLALDGMSGTFTTDLSDRKLGASYQLVWETYR